MQRTPFSPLPIATPQLVEIDRIGIRFGGIVALDDVSFQIGERQVVGLIGPNGAGKTTLFNCISRLYTPDHGDIRIGGTSVLGLPPHALVRHGVGRTFQNLALYDAMPVQDNVLVGLHASLQAPRWAEALGSPSVRRAEEAAHQRVRDVLAELGLSRFASRPVGELTYATRKRVEMARALVAGPRVLMLDEPAGGLNHEEVDELATLIRQLRDQHALSILLVEHHLGLVMNVSDRVVALDFGRKIADGTPSEVRNHPRVLSAYLGEAADEATA